MTVRAGVVGVGNMGRHHARNYAQLPGVKLVGVVDSDEARRLEIAGQNSCAACASLDELLELRPDVVSVCVPTSLHLEVVERLVPAGVSVLIEKPVAASLEHAQKIQTIAQNSKSKVVVGHIERFNPAVSALKALIEGGRLGEVIQIMTRREGPNPERIRDANIVFDIGTHDIDILNHLTGRYPVAVFASGGRFKRNDQEDYANLMLVYGGNNSYPMTGYIQVNWVTRAKVRRIEVTGTNGYASVDLIRQSVTLHSLDIPPVFSRYEDYAAIANNSEEITVEKAEPLRIELTGFVNYHLGEGKAIVTPEEGIAAVKIATYATQEIRAHKLAAAVPTAFGGENA